MKNIEKYESNLRAAIAAYQDEMADRTENGIDGLPFEDWAEEDTDTTARRIEDRRKEKEAAAKAEEEEKEAIRKGIVELKEFYKEHRLCEAMAIIDGVFALDPSMDIYNDLPSACNCMHLGMWAVWCDDFSAVWDLYVYSKEAKGICHSWDNPTEWMKQMRDLVQYIDPFIEDGKVYLDNLKAKAEGGQTK